MKIVKVTYTTKAEYAEQNKANVQAVMAELQNLQRPGINYTCCISPDGQTFIHTAFMQTDEDQKVLNELPSFKHFIDQLKASGPEVPPKQELLTLVGTSKPLFN